MRGAVLHAPRDIRFEERETPKDERRAIKTLLRP